jgi:hypothetical protein
MWQMILFLLILCGIVTGGFLIFKPSSAISFQKKFYEMINWRIEPISMSKELRNTRIMGVFLIVFNLLAAFYMLIRLALKI